MTVDYVAIKLTNGDEIVGIIVDSDEDMISILYPIKMRTVIKEKDGKMMEIATGSKWSQFTDDTVFYLYRQDIICMNDVNEQTITYYKTLVDVDLIMNPEYADQEPESVLPEVEEYKEIPEDSFFISCDNKLH